MEINKICNTINTVAFAVRKRMQGYHLLQNPKGISPYHVSMMKYNHSVDICNADQITWAFKVTRNPDASSKIVEDVFRRVDYNYIDAQDAELNLKNYKHFSRSGRKDFCFHISEKGEDNYSDAAMSRRSMDWYSPADRAVYSRIEKRDKNKPAFWEKDNNPNFFKVLYDNIFKKPNA